MPSLDGILAHTSISYGGLKRPPAVERIFDRPSSKIDKKAVEAYFHDLYGVLMKRLSEYVVSATPPSDEGVKLQAMIQELTKVKSLLCEDEIVKD